MPTSEFKRRLRYDPIEGRLYWTKTKPGILAGAETGITIRYSKPGRKSPYRHLKFDGKSYLAHRVAWVLTYGHLKKGQQIDHINHDGLDNRISNLRLVSGNGNHKNAPKRRDNTSGVTGVWWHAQLNKWASEIFVSGKKHALGVYVSKDDAIASRKAAEVKYGFHPNHGLSKAA
jgi:hypothetical protein